MSSRDADHIESQNDQRLDELHSKIRTLRSVTTDIHDDVERQNLTLDDTSHSFSSFGSSLSQSSQRAARVFGLSGGMSQCKFITSCVIFILGFWVAWRIMGWWFGGPS